MTYSAQEIATELGKAIVGGYSPTRVSSVAFSIYQEHCLEISERLDHYLMVLIAMEEGPEFEMTEAEFLELLIEIRRHEE